MMMTMELPLLPTPTQLRRSWTPNTLLLCAQFSSRLGLSRGALAIRWLVLFLPHTTTPVPRTEANPDGGDMPTSRHEKN